MKRYNVTGMSCAACQARVEKAVNALDGVTSCAVNLLTNSMGVEGDVSDAAVIAAVTAAGYGASVLSGGRTNSNAEVSTPGTPTPRLGARAACRQNTNDTDPLADTETPMLLRRLLSSLVFLLMLMYISMGHTMWNFPLPDVLARNPMALGLLQMLLCIVCMVIGKKFFISGAKSMFHRAPNMDALVALGSSSAFLWSVWELFVLSDASVRSDLVSAHETLHSLYFESAAMILSLITVGKMLEARAKGKTTDALRSLMRLAPQTARVLRDGEEVIVPIEEVRCGDTFSVHPGENIPCDGTVLSGESAVNEAALTGESLPVDKVTGDPVSAGSTNGHGVLVCEAMRVGEDTTLASVIALVSDAAATKAPIAKIADKVSGVFVPVVMAIALVTAAVWLALGAGLGFALARGISVLVISCPCALGLATPVAIMVGSGVGAKHGILFKTAAALEIAGKTDTVVLDKTGTVTEGRPVVTDIIPSPLDTRGGAAQRRVSSEYDQNRGETHPPLRRSPFPCAGRQGVLTHAAALEANSEHPLAAAVVEAAAAAGIKPAPVTNFRALPGNGVTAVDGDGVTLWGGSMKAFSETYPTLAADTSILKTAETLAGEGKTPLLFVRGDAYLGTIAVADKIKEDSPRAIRALRDLGVRVILLTGDNERTAAAVGKVAGVDEIIAGVLPDGKEAVVRHLMDEGHRVMMVGDGINDAPALARADIGCAIGAGTDVAIDSSDIVLVKSRLSDVVTAIRLSRRVIRNIHENLFWAFGYNLIGIPLAAGVFIPLLGWEMNPMFGAAAMSVSSFCVVSNALRLNLFKVPVFDEKTADAPSQGKGSPEGETPIAQDNIEEIQSKQENQTMTKTLKIEGMMCPRCEAHVKKALEAVDGIVEAVASHEAGSAIVTLSKDVDDAILKAAVEAEDYKVL